LVGGWLLFGRVTAQEGVSIDRPLATNPFADPVDSAISKMKSFNLFAALVVMRTYPPLWLSST
jgi:hypothetical protein